MRANSSKRRRTCAGVSRRISILRHAQRPALSARRVVVRRAIVDQLADGRTADHPLLSGIHARAEGSALRRAGMDSR